MDIELQKILELNLETKIGQFRATPVKLGTRNAILAIYCADFDVDPYIEMFFFPTDTLKMILFTSEGKILWKKDLGRGVVPGGWFCPVFAFDLDSDGVDEIYFVNNIDENHPLGVSNYRLERLDALTGETTGQWNWPDFGGDQSLSHTFRNFILGGYVKGEPVLVTAQGTYGAMFFQGWNKGIKKRWDYDVADTAPGARGSHMCPITDLDNDGIQEFMWGERCIELDKGKELFCADKNTYNGHTDVISPVLDRDKNEWFLFTCREKPQDTPPRVCLYDSKGNRVWGKLEAGHMDMGWTARLGENQEYVSMSIKIGHKVCGPDGRFHQDMEEFVYNTLSGEKVELPFSVYRTIPVDINGDGYHELVKGVPGGDGELLNRNGESLGSVKGTVAMASKFLDLPGEQLLVFTADGKVSIWVDKNAKDSPEALERYANPFYSANQKLTATGYNLVNLGGI